MEYYGQSCPSMVKSERFRKRLGHTHIYTRWQMTFDFQDNAGQTHPSHITVVGNRVLVSYGGQPMTCYGCNETGHLCQVCPMRQRVRETAPTATPTSWAVIAGPKTRNGHEDKGDTSRQGGQVGPAQ
jgi:hypothetical protein